MSRLRATARLAVLVAFEVGVLVVLHRLGAQEWLRADDLSTWFATATAEEAVVVAVHRLALAAAWWLAVSTALYALASATRLGAAVRSVEWATLPAVRRVADRAVAVTLASSLVTGAPAAALAAAPAAPALEVVAPPAGAVPSALPPLEDGTPSVPLDGASPPGVAPPSALPPVITGQDVDDRPTARRQPADLGAAPAVRPDSDRRGAAEAAGATTGPPAVSQPPALPPADVPVATEGALDGHAAERTAEAPSSPSVGDGTATRPPREDDAATDPGVGWRGASTSGGPTPAIAATPEHGEPASAPPPPSVMDAVAPVSGIPTVAGASADAATHVVVAGEHLWGIAAAHLAAVRGTAEVTTGEIAAYWRQVVASTTPTLRSGDADVVHPGETVVLPPAPPPPTG